MSIEMPEATILARQMQAELPGRTVVGFVLQDADKLQAMGFFNKDSAAFERLTGRTIESAVCRGNTMILSLTGDRRLIIFPEYGGEISLIEKGASLPARYQFRLDFADGSALTVRITSVGGVHALAAGELAESYVVKRDFDPDKFSPDDLALTSEVFAERLRTARRQLKPLLVGKDAFIVGLSNSAFQDIIYRAGLHPKRRGADLNPNEARALSGAVRLVVTERLRLGGKTGFRDLYGHPGAYEAAMGPAFRAQPCPRRGAEIQKLAHGGGEVFVCPVCQPEPG
jgi:formamidopyrimidine-DNA glycosylase